MLVKNPDDRISIEDLYDELKIYREDIFTGTF